MDHVSRRHTFPRKDCEIPGGPVSDKKLVGDDPCAFWKGVKFLDIQGGGASQTQLIALLASCLGHCGFEASECGEKRGSFLYIDDATFTGNRVKQDIEKWIAGDAPAKATVHIVMIAMHTGARYYAEQQQQGIY